MAKLGGELNPHHVLFTNKTWSAQKPTRILRQNQWLRVPLDRDTHEALHKEIATVPLPTQFMAEQVLAEFEPVEGDYMATIDNLRFAFQEASKSPRVHYVEKRMGGLIIETLGLEKVYLVGAPVPISQ